MPQDAIQEYHNLAAQLNSVELVWRDRQEYLESRGYLLRSRYKPGWTASWKLDPTIKPSRAEDFPQAYVSTKTSSVINNVLNPLYQLLRPHLMDATRISDGKLVILKRINADSAELKIAMHFSSRTMREDPRNHCVPVLDVVPDKDDPNKCFVVMPFLRYVDYPPFESIQSMLNCGEQLLEVRFIPMQVTMPDHKSGSCFSS